MKFETMGGKVVEAYEFAKLAEAPRAFADAVCFSEHGDVNPDRKPHMHGHSRRSNAILYFICEGYWLYMGIDTSFIYAMNGEDFAKVYRPLPEGGAA